jgi:uncharacterized protein
MKRVYLVHSWSGSSMSEPWFSWLKKELAKKKIEFYAFDFPNSEKPTIKEWVGFLKEKAKDVDEETYFIGHSIGCQTIMRYLEGLPENKKIGGCIFVAGWFNLTELSDEEKVTAESWLNRPIKCDKVKKHTANFLAIFSDDDPYVPLSDAEIFKEKLGAKIVIKHGEEHFNETKEIKEILEAIR